MRSKDSWGRWAVSGIFIKKGDRVLLKANLLSPSGPEKAVTTHPEFVRAVAREVKKAGVFKVYSMLLLS